MIDATAALAAYHRGQLQLNAPAPRERTDPTRIAAPSCRDSRSLKGQPVCGACSNATRYSIDGCAAWRTRTPSAGTGPRPIMITPAVAAGDAGREDPAGRVVVMVLIVELLNTAIEAAIDRDSLEINRSASAPRTTAAQR